MQAPFATHRAIRAFLSLLGNAFSAVEPGAKGKMLTQSEKMAVRFAVGAGEHQHGSALPLPNRQGSNQGIGNGNGSFLLVLDPEAHLRLRPKPCL